MGKPLILLQAEKLAGRELIKIKDDSQDEKSKEKDAKRAEILKQATHIKTKDEILKSFEKRLKIIEDITKKLENLDIDKTENYDKELQELEEKLSLFTKKSQNSLNKLKKLGVENHSELTKKRQKLLNKTKFELENAKSKRKKFTETKDDSEVSKIRRDKIKSEVESILPKKAKDDLEFLKICQKEIKNLENFLPKGTVEKLNSLAISAKQLQKIDVTKLKFTEINKLSDNLKQFFNNATSLLENDDPMLGYLKAMVGLIDKPDKSKIKLIIQQIQKETEKIEG